MTKLGLTLNEAKTSVKDARRQSFDFLGYTLEPRHFPTGLSPALSAGHRTGRLSDQPGYP
jgi:hypothetical protein